MSAAWTPYGLEAYRAQLLRRRRRMLLAAILGGLLVFGAYLVLTIRDSNSISTFGSGGSTVEVELPTDKPRGKPTTLTVSPGRTTVLDRPIQPEARPNAQPQEREPSSGGLNWLVVLQNVAPVAGAAIYAWRAGRKRFLDSLEQVNLGVYKGAMPYEMLSAEHERFIFTRQRAHAHLFGKGPGDFLAAKPVVAPRAARFERLR